MKRKSVVVLLFFAIVFPIIFANTGIKTFAACSGSITNKEIYDSLCVKSVTITTTPSGNLAAAEGKILIMGSEISGYDYSTPFQHSTNSWDELDVSTLTSNYDLVGISESSYTWTSGEQSVTINFPDNKVKLIGGKTYHVYLWTRFSGSGSHYGDIYIETKLGTMSIDDFNDIIVPTVKFNGNGKTINIEPVKGTKINETDPNSLYKFTEPAKPTCDGFIFGGWYKDAECTTKFDFSAGVSKDTATIEVFAKWTPVNDETDEDDTSTNKEDNTSTNNKAIASSVIKKESINTKTGDNNTSLIILLVSVIAINGVGVIIYKRKHF